MQPPPNAFIVGVVEEPTPEITLADVIFGAFGVVGVLVLLAVVLGGALSVLLVMWHRRHPPEDSRMPPVVPVVNASEPSRSYPAQ